jgi:DNA-directed RNA polymerase specialized sigma24 family protein
LTTLEIFRPRIPSSGLIITGGRPPGIDLGNRGHEVAKLLFAGFGDKIKAAHYDPDDVLQEVYKGILTRNAGICPWDPGKSSFGHYVHMICSCVMSNYHRKQTRVRSLEQIGVFCFDSDKGQDAAASESLLPAVSQVTELEILDFLKFLKGTIRGRTSDGKMAARILPLVYEGRSRMEIAELVGAPKATISRALSVIRVLLRAWMVSSGN